MVFYTLDENNKPVPETDVLVWGKFLADSTRRRVALTEINDEHDTRVSTVFLGISTLPGTQEMFETMVFSDDPDMNDYQQRYSTWEEAESTHNHIVEQIRKNNFHNGVRTKLNFKFKS